MEEEVGYAVPWSRFDCGSANPGRLFSTRGGFGGAINGLMVGRWVKGGRPSAPVIGPILPAAGAARDAPPLERS